MAFLSVAQMLRSAVQRELPLWETILEEDLQCQGGKRETSLQQMTHLWQVMQASSRAYRASDRSNSGLVGGDSARVESAYRAGKLAGGEFVNAVISEALKMGECNACMKRIVATPTAGSCGVLPAILIPLKRFAGVTDTRIVQALYVAAGFGQVVATRASIAGAQGGCQAEVGTASGMAAAALVYLKGGSNDMCAQACAMALAGLLGLVCDPVAGLVEVPCVQRNVVGALNALGSANMALAGVQCRIPVDEVIDAMGEVGDQMPASLRETGKGGLAATPTGKQIAKDLTRQLNEQGK